MNTTGERNRKRKRTEEIYNQNKIARATPFNNLKSSNYDKIVKSIFKTSVWAQVKTILYTATDACKIIGLRWTLCFTQTTGTSPSKGSYAIIRVRQNRNPNTLYAATSDYYLPTEDVMGYGCFAIQNNTETKQHIRSSESRKNLKSGDKIVFVVRGEATFHQINGTIQFFALK